MADKITEGTIPSFSDDEEPPTALYIVILHYFQLGLTSATFIYGVISWCLIKKYRSFNNYVYQNTLLVNVCRLSIVAITETYADAGFGSLLHFVIFLYFTTVYNYWILVMCYMFYVDVVKVFQGDIKRKFLKSAFLAWGLPLLVVIICLILYYIIEFVLKYHEDKLVFLFLIAGTIFAGNVLPVVINAAVFIRLVRSLLYCKDQNECAMSKKERRKDNWRRLSTATAMFMLTNVNVLLFIIWDTFDITVPIQVVAFSAQTIILALFVPLVKSNRRLWYEYCKILKKRFCCK